MDPSSRARKRSAPWSSQTELQEYDIASQEDAFGWFDFSVRFPVNRRAGEPVVCFSLWPVGGLLKKILVIDDDPALLKTVEIGLQHEEYKVLVAQDGREGLKAAFSTHPDLIILDLMLPEMDGLEVCRRLQELSDIPIIILTALSAESDVVKGLGVGADDYVTKPFRMAELVARIRNVLRRRAVASTALKAAVLVKGGLTIDLARHKVLVRGRPVDLTPTEFRLLSYLARNSGRVVNHRTLLLEVWGPEYCDQIDYLHLYIRYLRQKIEQNPGSPELLKTERGVGYYLEGE